MQEFPFAFDPRYRRMLKLIGVHEGNAMVTLDDDGLHVRFGRWRLSTPYDNIVGTEISGDYKWYKAIGARGSFVDRGVSFGTNTKMGLCVKFAEPVAALVIGDMFKHPGMTVTVADVEGLQAALRDAGATV